MESRNVCSIQPFLEAAKFGTYEVVSFSQAGTTFRMRRKDNYIKMKRTSWLLLFTLALPMSAFANSVDFANQGGSLTGTSAGLDLSGSTLSFAKGAGHTLSGNLGVVSFSTGAVSVGSLQTGAILAGGGSFTITGDGVDHIFNGVIFSGTFSGPVVWSPIALSNGTHEYILIGQISGKWFTGQTVSGATVALTINVGKGFFNGSTLLSSGNTDVTGNGLVVLTIVTPEPGSITLMSTGLLSLAGLARRRVSRL